MSDTTRLQVTLPGPMYRKLKRYGRASMAQFIREAVAEKLAVLGEEVTADVERGGLREKKSK